MKLFSKMGMALLVMAMIAFPSCDTNGDTYVGSGVDFTNHPASNAAFFVENQTNERLVAFAGSISMENLLGGIPARSGEHGIRRNQDIFNQTRALVVVLVTEEQFVANRNNLSVLNNAPFARIFALYHHNHPEGVTPARYTIIGAIGGRNNLVVQNPTGFDVDLRVGGPLGQSIGFIPARMSTTINVVDGDMDVFPVFVVFNPVTSTLSHIFPILPGRHPYFRAFSFSGGNALTFVLGSDFAISLGRAEMVIENQSMTPVQVQHGYTIIFNAMGSSFINPGERMTVLVEMGRHPDGSFSSQRTVSDFRVRVAGATVPLTDTAGNDMFTLHSDMRYTVTVTGSVTEGFTATIDLENAVPISLP